MSDYRKARLEKISDNKLYRQSVAAELLLNYAALRVWPDTELPLRIAETSRKPRFDLYGRYFSVSHSENIVGCAVSDEEVGLDIQFQGNCSMKLAKRFYSDYEYKHLMSAEDKDRLFYMQWALKESYVKAHGGGISSGFSDFSVDTLGLKLTCGPGRFWHRYMDGFHFALCTLGYEQPQIEELKFIPIEKLF